MTESSGVTSVCVLLDVICELLSPIMWLQDNERSYLVKELRSPTVVMYYCCKLWVYAKWFLHTVIRTYRMIGSALCSRIFQNVKLRLEFVEIWSFYRLSDFTWNQIMGNSNGPKMSFLPISEVLNFDFSKFGTWKLLKFTKNQNSEPLKLAKITFLDCLNSPKFDVT